MYIARLVGLTCYTHPSLALAFKGAFDHYPNPQFVNPCASSMSVDTKCTVKLSVAHSATTVKS